jgi:hypothetical protein
VSDTKGGGSTFILELPITGSVKPARLMGNPMLFNIKKYIF